MPRGFLDRTQRFDYWPALTVAFASRYDQIHLKLMALADRGYPRDRQDLRNMEPTRSELVDAAKWVRSHFAPGPMHDQLSRVLFEFEVADDAGDA